MNAELDNIWLYNAFYFPLDFIVSTKSRAAITLQCIIWLEIWTPSMEEFWLNMPRNYEVCLITVTQVLIDIFPIINSI